jgi:chromosome segregation ATPase
MELKYEDTAYVSGGSEPLDVTRECELALEVWDLKKETNGQKIQIEKLIQQKDRCEDALRKCNALIQEYIRRGKVTERRFAKSERELSTVQTALGEAEAARESMSRTWGKHRNARIVAEGNLNGLQEAFNTLKAESAARDALNEETIAELKRNRAEAEQAALDEIKRVQGEYSKAKTEAEEAASELNQRRRKQAALDAEVLEAKRVAKQAIENVPESAPFKELKSTFESTQQQLFSVSDQNRKLMAKVEHLTKENNHVVSFAFREGLEIPGLSSMPI